MKDVEYLKWTDAPFSNKCSWLILQLSFTSMQNEFMTFFLQFIWDENVLRFRLDLKTTQQEKPVQFPSCSGITDS